MDMELLIVGCIVVIAAAFMVRKIVKAHKGNGCSCGCGSCGQSCKPKKL